MTAFVDKELVSYGFEQYCECTYIRYIEYYRILAHTVCTLRVLCVRLRAFIIFFLNTFCVLDKYLSFSISVCHIDVYNYV